MNNPDPDETEPIPDPLLDPEATEDPVDRGFVSEVVRKVAVAGLGALFMTEEGIRNLAGQMKLPKEALGYILTHAEKTKDDIGRVASEEIRRFFQSELLRQEFLKLLTGMTVEIKAEVRLVPNAGEKAAGEQPQTAKVELVEVRAKRGKKKKE